ncbi:hypothetical protein NUW54_g11564 [Trametes sanguinea]|uniref:Uncharacterized protein n=1 Tax=Trametes sanguinea TaxID=158606 RepID=A0ACC1NAY5_9APHY|nr:hypothetical protein NUW54_g11564 [Trametes sanguinea]
MLSEGECRTRLLTNSSIEQIYKSLLTLNHYVCLYPELYSGLTPLSQALPTDIGAAAAYEMYRAWKHNSFLYEPLSADRAQQREGLIGMAIAEATQLWQYSGCPMDIYGQWAAFEAAGAAASVLADRVCDPLA